MATKIGGNRGKVLAEIEAKNKKLRAQYEIKLTREVFNKFDEDNSESIDADEFRLLCKALGYEFATKADVDNAMKMLDDDASGTIEWDEFAAWWTSGDKFADFQHLLDDSAFFMDDKSKAGELVAEANEEDAPDWPPLMLHPFALFRTVWDGLSAIAIIYSALFVPLRMSFDLELDYGSAAHIFDKVVDVLFISDMFLSFRTAYYDAEHEEMVTDPGRVASNYLKGWFVPDFAASVPLDTIAASFMGADQNPDNLRVLKLIRLLRLLKIMRMVKMSRLLTKLQEKLTIKSGIMMSIKFTLLCFATAHYLACLWFVMHRSNAEPWAKCRLEGLPDYPTVLSLGDCPAESVFSYMDAHNVHLTTMSADNMINNFMITDRKHEHSFIPVKKTSSWVYNYFSPHGYFGGSAAVVEWYFQCDAEAGLRYFVSKCKSTASGDMVMASSQQECSLASGAWDTTGDATASGCVDMACLGRGENDCLVKEEYNHIGDWGEDFPEKNVNDGSLVNPLGHVELYVVYWTAFYWSITTMTTLGYGEINASDSEEQFFVMFAIMVGVVVFAYGITNMCTLVANLNAQEVFAQTRSDEIIEWMSNNSVPDHFKKKVMQYFTYKISYSPVFYYDGETLLEELSPELKYAVLVDHYLPILQYSSLFAYATREAVDDPTLTDPKLPLVGPLIESLKCEVFFPGEIIVDPGLYVRGLFFMVHGNVTITTKTGEQSSLEPGQTYGEYALKARIRATETLQANAYLDAFVLAQEDFAKILKRNRILIDTFDWDANGIRNAPDTEEEQDPDPVELGLTDSQKKLRELEAMDMEQEELIMQLLNTMDKQDKFGKSSIADGV